ncbi:MAG: crossover junction endodeoxyribonuclease RuvC [Spirochaetaceae bacterium]|jgi:crossover junction endodeoxyribonuclease RuvC|nr:crossover junction endodeoxyribonuclease RuvC [Spirochaetaceae bacterium]
MTRLIIGIDPGLASTGWGILESSGNKLRYIAHGCVETSPRTSHPERLLQTYNEIIQVINLYKPGEAAMESLFFGKNARSAMSVAEARGVVGLAMAQNNLIINEFQPRIIKQSVTGMATASKEQVQEMVRMLLGLQEIPEPNHSADALAAAITAANYR